MIGNVRNKPLRMVAPVAILATVGSSGALAQAPTPGPMPGTVQMGEPGTRDGLTRTIESEHARALQSCEQRPPGERLDCRYRADLDRDEALAGVTEAGPTESGGPDPAEDPGAPDPAPIPP